ncbi:PEF-CTERM sorting domain-containing protein [Methanosarcina sp. Mfa9]|uniref:PEF-CTERM sorting domain-containing protein n=1 Tax=Methanosarcina sp. Mfa9 TaxID=3439063 RepID=UPI003F87D5AC
MRAIYFVGILAFFIITVSAASATTFDLTETTDDYKCGVPIRVQVDYESNCIKLTVVEPVNDSTFENATGNYTISNVDIKDIWIKNGSNSIVCVSDLSDDNNNNKWIYGPTNSKSIGSFGDFQTFIGKEKNKYKTIGPIEIRFKDNVGTPPLGSSYSIAAHVAFNLVSLNEGSYQEVGCSGKVTGTNIPEFPSVVLPVAAIMGILLISQNWKKER